MAGAIVSMDSSNNSVKSKTPSHFVAGPNPSTVAIGHLVESAAIMVVAVRDLVEGLKNSPPEDDSLASSYNAWLYCAATLAVFSKLMSGLLYHGLTKSRTSILSIKLCRQIIDTLGGQVVSGARILRWLSAVPNLENVWNKENDIVCGDLSKNSSQS